MQTSNYNQVLNKFKWQRHWKETLRQKSRIQQARDIVESIIKPRAAGESERLHTTILVNNINKRHIEKERQLFQIHLTRLSRKQREYLLELGELQQDEQDADITEEIMEEFLQHFFPSVYSNDTSYYGEEEKTDLLDYAYQILREMCGNDAQWIMQQMLFVENMKRRSEILHLLLELNTKMNQLIKQYNVYSITNNPYIDNALERIAEKELWYLVASKINLKKTDPHKPKKIIKKQGPLKYANNKKLLTTKSEIIFSKNSSMELKKPDIELKKKKIRKPSAVLSNVKHINYEMLPSTELNKKRNLVTVSKLIYVPPSIQEKAIESKTDNNVEDPFIWDTKNQDSQNFSTNTTTADSCTVKSWSPSILNYWSPSSSQKINVQHSEQTSKVRTKRFSKLLCGVNETPAAEPIKAAVKAPPIPSFSCVQNTVAKTNNTTCYTETVKLPIKEYLAPPASSVKSITSGEFKSSSYLEPHMYRAPHLVELPKFCIRELPTEYNAEHNKGPPKVIYNPKSHNYVKEYSKFIPYMCLQTYREYHPCQHMNKVNPTVKENAIVNLPNNEPEVVETSRIIDNKDVYHKSNKTSFWNNISLFFTNSPQEKPKPFGRNKSRFYCTN